MKKSLLNSNIKPHKDCPTISDADQKKIEKMRNRLPKGVRDFGDACQNAVHVLMNEQNLTHDESLKIVDDLIKQSMPYVNQGMYAQSIACLEKVIYTK